MVDKLYCMDALELMRTLPDASIDLVFTDPPYNISQRSVLYRDYRSGERADISFDFGEWDYTFDPIPFLEEAKRVLTPEGSVIVWTSEQLFAAYRPWFAEHMYPKQLMVWVKSNPVPQFRKVGYRQSTELLYWVMKSKLKMTNPNFIFTTQEDMKNVFYAPIVGGKERLKRPDTGKSHPTQKPLPICRKLVRTHCRPEGLVLDPYCGVGTIPLAAALEGRHFIGGDFDPIYLEMAQQRIARHALIPEDVS